MKFTAILVAAAVASNVACTGKSADLPAKECAAWQDFFDALDGPNWVAFGKDGRNDPCSVKSKIGNPCKGDPAHLGTPSNFTLGITKQKPHCDINGERDVSLPPWQEPDAGVCCKAGPLGKITHITQMAFALNGLKGKIPDSINDLQELDNLSACGNDITTLAKDMTGTKIGFLRLHVNKVAGPMPASYSNITTLEYISMSDNLMTGPMPVMGGAAQPKLRGAYLDCNAFSGAVPAAWGGKLVSDFKDCFLSEGEGEKCAKGYTDNALTCPLPAGADKNCHAKCK